MTDMPLRNRTTANNFHTRTVPINQSFNNTSYASEFSNQNSRPQFSNQNIEEEFSRRGERRQQVLFSRNDPIASVKRDTTAELKSRDTNLKVAKTIGIRNTGNSCYVNSVI
jgi:uncharacterized UBP type Zn finger protein